MKVYRNNGEYWYEDMRGPFKRIRQWFIGIGGWEEPNGQGWRFRRPTHTRARGWKWLEATPVSMFGHRLTFYGWGVRLRLGTNWVLGREYHGSGKWLLYASRDGSSGSAHIWLIGAPYEVRRAVEIYHKALADGHVWKSGELQRQEVEA